MSTANLQVRLLFAGGWATDFGPTSPVGVQQDGTVQIPFLVNAENCVYDLDGGPKKIMGTTRLSSELDSGTNVNGLTDFWVIGTGGAAAQHRVVHVGPRIKADDGNGVFADIDGGVDKIVDAIVSYAIYDDDLILMSDSSDVPLKWNPTVTANVATLGTNTPNGAFGATHKNRFFMAGVDATPSRLFYCEPLPNGADGNWDEVEAGFIDFDPNDGDRITGLISHKGELWVFKGPYLGSIHRLIGDTPLGAVTAFGSSTQPVPFSVENFVRGLGAINHNSIFRFKDDVGFLDGRTGSIHSLKATAAFGDFREAALSFPIASWLRDHVSKGSLDRAWSVSDVSTECVAITLPIDAATENNVMLCMDHRFEPVRWSQWPAIQANCLALVTDSTSNRGIPYIGDTLGYVRRMEQANRSIDGITGIAYKATTPYLDFGNPVRMKTLERASVGIQPKGDYNGTFSWARDGRAQQSTTFSQGGGDVLGGAVSSSPIISFADSGGNLLITVGGAAHGLLVGDIVSIRGISGAITAIAQNGTDITVTAASHTLLAGDKVVIAGTTSYNAEYTVTSISAGVSFDVTATFVADETGTFHESNYNGRYTILTVPSTTTFTVAATYVSDSLGFVDTASQSNFFVLGTSTLSGGRFVDRFFSLEEGGEFRSIQLEVTQSGNNEDIEIHNLSMTMALGADSGEN